MAPQIDPKKGSFETQFWGIFDYFIVNCISMILRKIFYMFFIYVLHASILKFRIL